VNDRLARLMAELRQMAELESVRVETHPGAADPADGITGVAIEEDADVIVVGSESDNGTPHLPNVPEAVMDKAACAVLVV